VFCILKPKHQVQLSELVETDSESGDRFDRAHDKNQQEFEMTTTDFTSNTNDHETETDNLEELDTYTSRSKKLSSYKLAHRVDMLISESLEKGKNQLKNTKKNWGQRAQKNNANIQCRFRICNNDEFGVRKRRSFHGL
jgi:hypothetical protein